MANMVKFDLQNIPPWLTKLYEGIDLGELEMTKKSFIAKYWPEEHAANMAIAKEIWAPETVREKIWKISFTRLMNEYQQYSLSDSIAKYCDLRVWPYGIVSTDGRLEEAAKRHNNVDWENELETSKEFLQKVEQDIFKFCTIKVEYISDETVSPLIETLRKYDIML